MADDNQGFYGRIPSIPQFNQAPEIARRLVSASGDDQDGPIWRFKGLVTYEKPIREYPGDILIPVNAAGSVTTLRSGVDLPTNCVGLRFLSLLPGVTVSLNGGGLRTVLNGDVFSGCEITSLIVFTDAAGTCIVQAVGTGD